MDESFQQQALHVPDIDENFDPYADPTDGEQYLMQVIYERRNCPSVVVKPYTISSQNGESSVKNTELSIANQMLEDLSDQLHPTDEWKASKLIEFMELREKIVEYRGEPDLSSRFLKCEIPPIRDVVQWKNFCQSHLPLLSIVLQLDQPVMEYLIEFFANRLDEYDSQDQADTFTANSWLNKWIYSIFACIHIPFEPNVYGSLRQIAKTCIHIRNQLNNGDEENATHLNLFIFLIAQFFRQLDLDCYITCPGVWLCQRGGSVEVVIKTLGYQFSTDPKEPKFPLLYHKVYFIDGYFYEVQMLSDLECVLLNEPVEICLVQRNLKLAYYVGKLGQLLTVNHSHRKVDSHCRHLEHELLMVPLNIFPGIIAPKIYLSTKFRVKNEIISRDPTHSASGNSTSIFLSSEEHQCEANCKKHKSDNSNAPKFFDSKRQKSVCHTKGYFRKHNKSNNFPKSESYSRTPLSSEPNKDVQIGQSPSETGSRSLKHSENICSSTDKTSHSGHFCSCSTASPSSSFVSLCSSNSRRGSCCSCCCCPYCFCVQNRTEGGSDQFCCICDSYKNIFQLK